jgi:hypothetical protein
MSDKLQSVLWCVNQVVSMRRIKKPRHRDGLVVAELDALIELHMILEVHP